MKLNRLVDDLNSMILEGKAMEAFEKYYAEDVVMQGNELPPTIGEDANREREKEFFSKVVEFRGADVTAVAVGDGVTMVAWFFDYTHEDWGNSYISPGYGSALEGW
jgi:hypothetical protein